MNRRAFLALVALLPGCTTIGVTRPCLFQSALPLDELAGVEGALALGRRYLDLVPAERTAAQLERRLVAGLGDATPEATRAWLAARIPADFAQGETMAIDGWMFARTELRIDALVALRFKPGA